MKLFSPTPVPITLLPAMDFFPTEASDFLRRSNIHSTVQTPKEGLRDVICLLGAGIYKLTIHDILPTLLHYWTAGKRAIDTLRPCSISQSVLYRVETQSHMHSKIRGFRGGLSLDSTITSTQQLGYGYFLTSSTVNTEY